MENNELNYDGALRDFCKSNFNLLTTPKFDKNAFKTTRRTFFYDKHNKRFGMPEYLAICKALVKYSLKTGVQPESLIKNIAELPIFQYISEANRTDLIQSVKADKHESAFSIDDLAIIKKVQAFEAVKQIHGDEIKKSLSQEIAVHEEKLRQTKEEYAQAKREFEDLYSSILDEEPPVEPDFDPQIESIKPWWERFYLRGNPFPNKTGLNMIEQDMYESIVVKTKPFQRVLSALKLNDRYLFNTAFMLIGDYGFGKTTFMQYLSYYLIQQSILPIRITCRRVSTDYGAFLNDFYLQFRNALEDELRHSQTVPSGFQGKDAVDQIIEYCKLLVNERRKGIVVFLDDYHKHDTEYPAVYDFLGALQVLKDDLTMQNLPIGFMVSGHTRWKEVMVRKQQMSGFFDSSAIEMPSVTPKDVCEVFNKRISAYCYDQHPREIRPEFVKYIFGKGGQGASYREYLNQITQALEDDPFAIVNTPLELDAQELQGIQEDLESDPTLKESLTKLVKLSTFKKYTREQIAKCLELLVQTTLQRGISEDDHLFVNNPFYFQRLRESGLLQQKKVTTDAKKTFKWTISKRLQNTFDVIQSKYNRAVSDYLLKIYAFAGYSDRSDSLTMAESDAVRNLRTFFSQTSLSLPPAAKDNLQRAFTRFDAVQLASPSDSMRPQMIDNAEEAIDALSTAFFEIDGSLPYYKSAGLARFAQRWQQHWSDEECVHEFFSRLIAYRNDTTRQNYEHVLKQVKEAFPAIAEQLRLIVEDVCCLRNTGFSYRHKIIQQSSAGRDVFDYVQSCCTSADRQVHFGYVKKITDYLEERFRSFFFVTSVLLFGDKYFEKLPASDKDYAHQNMDARPKFSTVTNMFKGLTRKQFRNLFEQNNQIKELIIEPMRIDWSSQDWKTFFDVFCTKNIDSSHNQDDSYSHQDRNHYLRYCANVQELTGHLNRHLLKLVCENAFIVTLKQDELRPNDILFKFSYVIHNEKKKNKQRDVVIPKNKILGYEDAEIILPASENEHSLTQETYERIMRNIEFKLQGTFCYSEDMTEIEYLTNNYDATFVDFIMTLIYSQFARKDIKILPWFGSSMLIKKEIGRGG